MDIRTQEKRICPRAHVSEPVHYQFKNPQEFGGCLSADISESGIRLVVPEFIPLESSIVLQVQLPNGRYAEAEARVKWVHKYPHMERYQVGLEFVEPYEARPLIHRYIQWSN